MIEVRSLSRHFGGLKAVDDVSFSVAEGEVLGFLGPNGAGKTTTMRILTGTLGATSGSVIIAGHDVQKRSRLSREAIGYLPEQPPLYPSMTVNAYLDHAARLRRVPSRDRKSAVDRALQRCSLTDVSKRVVGHLSKGYRQRVGVAQALVHEPKLLVLDEPTSGLDPAQMAEIRNLIAELKGEHTIVLSTHILSEVTASCDRVLIINQGRLVAAGTESELMHSLGHGQRVRVELARPDGQEAAVFAALPGVVDVQDRGAGRYVVLATEDVREALNAAAARWGLLESRAEAGLEDLYLQAVAGTLTAGQVDAGGGDGDGDGDVDGDGDESDGDGDGDGDVGGDGGAR